MNRSGITKQLILNGQLLRPEGKPPITARKLTPGEEDFRYEANVISTETSKSSIFKEKLEEFK